MRIKNKKITFGVKLSKDYNTVNVEESFEVELEGSDSQQYIEYMKHIEVIKQEMKKRVIAEAQKELDKVCAKELVL